MGPSVAVYGVAFAPNGDVVACGSDPNPFIARWTPDGTLLWDDARTRPGTPTLWARSLRMLSASTPRDSSPRWIAAARCSETILERHQPADGDLHFVDPILCRPGDRVGSGVLRVVPDVLRDAPGLQEDERDHRAAGNGLGGI